MKPLIHIDGILYDQTLRSISDMHFLEARGSWQDFSFYYNDMWLSDTAVIEHLTYHKGMWQVLLLFAHYTNPLLFIIRRIDAYSCKNKANLTATLMRRLAAKDQRGTLQVSLDSLEFSPN